ncbi:MAG: sulfite exporter TauE/SafE family protein [Desulfovibrio sp.]|nr:sulfite exporter TauE/SafE family protein [Desulfovibrio sp.]
MNFWRQLYEFLLTGSKAYAKWDLEVSTSILKNRKKMLFLLALAVPVIVGCLVEAYADGHEMLGGKAAYAPAFYTSTIFLASIAVGLAAGLITGCIGAGGGFIITPALMAVGVKGILAVGTDLFHIFAKAIMGTTIHKKLGNVSAKLAIAFLVGSIAGTFIGGFINKGLYNTDPLLSELFISTIYALLLGFLGFYALFDFLRATRGTQVTQTTQSTNAGLTGLSVKMQSMAVPPMITFDEDLVPGGRRISGWIVAAGGVIVGLLAAIMGVGGGFVTFPMFVYVFGVSSMTTVGTDILQIIFTAGFAAIGQYAIYGYVFYTLAIGMLLGSLLGIQIGALTTKVVKGVHIRGFYAMSIIAGFINRVSVLPKKLVEMEVLNWNPALVNGIETVGNYIFWGVVAIFGLWVFSKFFVNLGKLRGEA